MNEWTKNLHAQLSQTANKLVHSPTSEAVEYQFLSLLYEKSINQSSNHILVMSWIAITIQCILEDTNKSFPFVMVCSQSLYSCIVHCPFSFYNSSDIFWSSFFSPSSGDNSMEGIIRTKENPTPFMTLTTAKLSKVGHTNSAWLRHHIRIIRTSS